MRKIITAMFVVTFVTVEAALFYAGHMGLNLGDLSAPARNALKARADMWMAAYAPEAYQSLHLTLPSNVEQALEHLFPARAKPAVAALEPSAKSTPGGGANAGHESGDLRAARDALSAAPPSDDPHIDVARISKDGASVFAGTAKPNEPLTLFADGIAIAEVTTDDTGSWSLVTAHRFATLDPSLTLERGRRLAKGDPEAPATLEPDTHADHQRLAESEAQDAIKNFEAIVDAARREKAAEGNTVEKPPVAGASTAAAPETPGATSANGSTATSAAATGPATAKASSGTVVKIPVPITFVYKRAELTKDGTYAARLLLDFVKIKGLTSVSLTGHADERGSQDYNFDLSRERLDAIAKLLRDGGYGGELKLIPKGKSEPYLGIDRKALPREALYQADRRVELKYVR